MLQVTSTAIAAQRAVRLSAGRREVLARGPGQAVFEEDLLFEQVAQERGLAHQLRHELVGADRSRLAGAVALVGQGRQVFGAMVFCAASLLSPVR
jgi:hypothetical protein